MAKADRRSISRPDQVGLTEVFTKNDAQKEIHSVAVNGSSQTHEWLAADPTRLEGAQYADLHKAEELYMAILEVVGSWNGVDQRKDAREAVVKLYLWGEGFLNGKLSVILAQVEELRDMVVALLQELGQLVCQGMYY